ncbi:MULTISPECIES: 2-hydroxyacid dehydrogenase [Microbacterium]|uniref:Hydroxyacid dehydrogenase n=1 Tax=Microbacterium wangchenii TaxID=2541726 RepID=A0ABX5SPX6_9MICO|nr:MULTISPECIES: 2-hydroxyacid dehydrogenase [Microbacterium]MCK6066355.1 2-hydroxyacid dehydrogenase [Microbacterium sp. EYE_512]QBR87325.1 hydroxyacid dehydrogenase [Microbacterium wangchenii]TXK14646.1 2-hydroxyacid dehydrogenase [Microbacterium wangchenii]
MTSVVVSVPTEQLAADIQPLPDGVDVVVWDLDSPAPRDRFDMVVPPYMGLATVLKNLSGIEVGLIQSQSIGYDGVDAVLPEGQAFANASSVHETSTAELAVALTLAVQRGIPGFVRAQDAGKWSQGFAESLADRRVTLLGYGGVGKAIAARLAGFEVQLRAVASRARTEDGIEVAAIDDLAEVLADTEVLIASLPGGESTTHLIDDAALSALPDGSLVVNVGRGPLIDTDALVDHVRRGRIRAALDVTDPEPLPEGHPLWGLPGVLIAPHVGGATTAMRPRIARLVKTQIERLHAGEPPLNVVLGG